MPMVEAGRQVRCEVLEEAGDGAPGRGVVAPGGRACLTDSDQTPALPWDLAWQLFCKPGSGRALIHRAPKSVSRLCFSLLAWAGRILSPVHSHNSKGQTPETALQPPSVRLSTEAEAAGNPKVGTVCALVQGTSSGVRL